MVLGDPAPTRDKSQCVKSFNKFIGPKDKVGLVYNDNARELIAACDTLNLKHDESLANVEATAGSAENAVRRVIGDTRCLLAQSRFDHACWKTGYVVFLLQSQFL